MIKRIRVICPYCDMPAKLVTGDKIYRSRPDLHAKYFYLCLQCRAYVGCHPKGNGRSGTEPLGRLANKELRRLKQDAHAHLDRLWLGRSMTRQQAYKWLAEALGIAQDNCHIGMFDEALCKRVIEACMVREKEMDIRARIVFGAQVEVKHGT